MSDGMRLIELPSSQKRRTMMSGLRPVRIGVTGSNLKRRIEQIMRNRNVVGVNLGRKVILTGAGMAALVAPMIIGSLSALALPSQDIPDWQTKAGGKIDVRSSLG
jgi:hypothetical protein